MTSQTGKAISYLGLAMLYLALAVVTLVIVFRAYHSMLVVGLGGFLEAVWLVCVPLCLQVAHRALTEERRAREQGAQKRRSGLTARLPNDVDTPIGGGHSGDGVVFYRQSKKGSEDIVH